MNAAGLIGHWPSSGDTGDHSPTGHTTRTVHVTLAAASPDEKRRALQR